MLVGRERELETALAVCRAAEQGRGSVLVVLGEPGIGKTALLGEIGSMTQSRLVLRATGVEAESTVAFATLQGVLWPLRDHGPKRRGEIRRGLRLARSSRGRL